MAGQSPVPPPPGPPAGRKPTLAERLDAMADRHGTYQPPPTPDPAAPPPTVDQAVATLTDVLPVEWVRRFDTLQQADGSTMYVDTQTGQMYDTLPALHSKDGHDT